MNINDMPAGREMDTLVASKVFGCNVVWRHDGVLCACTDPPEAHAVVSDNHNIPYLLPYSTEIYAAWQVVKELGRFRGGPHNIYKPAIRLEYYEHDGIATVTVGRCKGIMGDNTDIGAEVWEEHGDADADKAMALAICRAALKAVGA